MTPRSFEKLFSQIDRDRKATVPYSVLVRLIRGSGTPLSPDQLARLEALDTDILCVGKRRYTFGETSLGCWLYELNEAGTNEWL